MLIEKYIDKEFVTIQPEFDIFKILDIFDGCDYSSVPVVENGKYLGVIKEKDIFELQTDAETPFDVRNYAKDYSVQPGQSLFDACNVLFEQGIDIVPVVDEENNYLGVLTERSLLQAVTVFGENQQNGIIWYQVSSNDLHLSQMAYIVEENGAHIVSLSVLPDENSTNLTVMVKLDTANVAPVVQSLERRGYSVEYSRFHSQKEESDLQRNYENLMRYLSV
ncbi:MAG: CBS domain-containing protein [Bacteroidales bacterium]|nr:CBS domain-containing protein [Bacteroidales bacterium]